MKNIAIFDLDGTLTDTLASLWKCGSLALSDAGLPMQPIEAYKYFAGDGADELVRRILTASGDVNHDNFTFVRRQYGQHFKEYVNYKVKPYDGIIENLNILKSNGIKLAVNTNKPQNRAIEVVEQFFGKNYFDIIVGECPERPRKPDPDGIIHILDELKLSPDNAVYFGDTNVDMKTGKSAGVYTVGVLWGFRDRKELQDNNADMIISSPGEIPGIFDNMNK